MRNLLVVMSVVAIAPIAQSFAAPCRVPDKPNSFKWETPLSVNEIYKSHPPGDPSTWKFTKQRYYYGRLYKDTPEDACKLWAKLESPTSGWTPAQRNLTEVIDLPPSTTTKMCVFDCFPTDGTHHGDGVLDDDDVSECGIAINAQTALQTEDMCDSPIDVAKTPYGSEDSPTTNYVRGADFTSSQKTKIKDANSTKMIPQPDGTELRIFNSDAYKISTAMDEQFLLGDPGFDDSAEVDHLIPRKDKFGCGCGTNAPSNALLISRKLNNAMSNNSKDKNRKAILAYFAPTSMPSPAPVETVPGDSDDVSEDETAVSDVVPNDDDDASDESEPDAAGCSAGGSNLGGFGFGAVALGLTQLARRVRRRN